MEDPEADVTIDAWVAMVWAIIPTATIAETDDGELVIYTGLMKQHIVDDTGDNTIVVPFALGE